MELWFLVLLLVLGCLAIYVVLSVFLLRNPHLLHHKIHLQFSARNIAHRGGCGEKLESTMEAFNHAKAVGADMFELDCHMTKDGHVIVSHDGNLLRQTGVDVDISSLNLQDLSGPSGPLYKENLEVTFNIGHYSSGEDRRFVLLEDVFKAFPSMPINIEVKEDNDQLIQKVASLVKSYGRDAITVWASERDNLMNKCREQNPDMPFSFTIERSLQLLILFYTGLLPFISLRETLLQFYLPRIFNRKYTPEHRELRTRLGAFLYDKLTMRKALFEHLVKRGMQVHLFVCNEDSDIQAAFDAGATGVMSDYPTLLSDWLRRHPDPVPAIAEAERKKNC
ncbi:lysophospholipase D GDPD3-like [Engraulis encrasicolus]|uniref:lysophospholipase D GDPD3-like n=1 Tax=Engraulis encrasicolus TaxID=184585 RepID=UPI002FCF8FB7